MNDRRKGMWLAWLIVVVAWPLPLVASETVPGTRYGDLGLQIDNFLSISIPDRAENSRSPAVPPEIVAQSAPLKLQLSETVTDADPRLAQAAMEAPVADKAPASDGLKFEIRRYLIEGNTLLSPDVIDEALAPFTGRQKDFGDVQRGLEAVQNAYQERGYASVQVMLPEQELDKGEVRFLVIETKIGKITVEGNEHFSGENIRRSVPALASGKTPNSREIAASIKVANESPAKQTAVLLRSGGREGEIDAVMRVADIDPRRYAISFDNSGNNNTGRYRVGFAFQHANLWDRDHVLTAQYLTSPENPNKVTALGVGYHIPLYARGDSMDFVAGYSNVDSGTVQDLFAVTGQGAIYALRYNQALPRLGEIDQKLIYGIDYKAYKNNVQPIGQEFNLIPDLTIHPLSIAYAGVLRDRQQEFSYIAQISQNLPGGSDGTDTDFKNARTGARAAYRVYRLGGSYSRATAQDWQFRANFNAQYTEHALAAGEQFGLGGAESIRGFNERYASNDRGYRSNFEIYTPDFGGKTGLDNLRLRLLTFYDTGTLGRNERQLGELSGASLDSVGFGIRLNYNNYFNLKLDYAKVLHDGTQFETPAARTHASRIHGSIAITF